MGGDITPILVEDNVFYLYVIIDLFSRKVIAYRVHYKNNTNLTINTFKDAYENRCEPKGTIFHSDRGVQYTSFEYRQLLRSLGIKSSFSNTGNPYDNAVIEAFFSNLKKEEVNRNQYSSFEDLNKSISKYIDFYNSQQPHSYLKGKTPNEFEEIYFNKKKKYETSP